MNEGIGIRASLVLIYTRLELPGWGRVLTWADKSLRAWPKGHMVIVRGKFHGYLMSLDLSDWAQRMTFFLGRYYELGVQRVLSSLLKQGDSFVDVGGNIGMITLHASHLVGESGRIQCFEPLPQCASHIREHIRLNNIRNVTLHNVALSDQVGSLPITLSSDHTGTATLASVCEKDIQKQVTVAVRRGDDEIALPVDVIKIDVEGFELRVLRGLELTIDRDKPSIIMEMIDKQLLAGGTSTAEVAAFLLQRNYRPYSLGSRRNYLRHSLALRELSPSEPWQDGDVLWIHPVRGIDVSGYVVR